ncbi:hypothetical protein CAP47_11815 [Psychroflexus sp. S27]|uniref:PLDc N-terminal domain-containing protein n=1 Tax=Psychroflexus sp. S27 TaxID=1982757 RepID=UPI000C29AF6C|nr:PLDc N-terminal domain-containing protein [Psychroflexus sp. S27]PJX20210.1 hypothetical protein CAP47_11815 [Psychroflexus sp. S27]
MNLIGPFTILSIGIIYFAALVTSLYFVFKSEKGFMAFLWTLFIIFVPFIGSLVYIFKYFVQKNKKRLA